MSVPCAPAIAERRNAMTRISTLPAAFAAASLVAAALTTAAGTPPARAQQPVTQTSPLATEPLPAQGGGQVSTGAAVTGSSPGPSGTATDGPPAPSRVDNSQAQQGKLLKPGESADDMKAA